MADDQQKIGDAELPCPRCGYDLRGPAPPDADERFECSECGAVNTANSIRRAARESIVAGWPAIWTVAAAVMTVCLLLVIGAGIDGLSALYLRSGAIAVAIGAPVAFWIAVRRERSIWERILDTIILMIAFVTFTAVLLLILAAVSGVL